MVIIGPEQPLVDGLVDFLDEKKVRVFGPSKFSAQLEGSKAFMKNLCKKNNIPTADFGTFDNFQKASSSDVITPLSFLSLNFLSPVKII